MVELAIVTVDSKSRVTLKGARKGERFRIDLDGQEYRLKPVATAEALPVRNPTRRNLPMPKLDLTQHLDRLRDGGLEWKPSKQKAPGPCRF